MNEVFYAIVAGVLFAGGLYLLTARHLTRLVAGLILLSQSVNLALLLAGGLTPQAAPLTGDEPKPAQALADPVPQALILTAIVITFALVAFAVAVYQRLHHATGVEDVEDEAAT